MCAAVPGAAPSFGFLRRSHLLKFAKKESLDLVHWVIFSDHCSINLRPCNHNQLACHSHEDSCGITITTACLSLPVCLCVCVYLGLVCHPLPCIPGSWWPTQRHSQTGRLSWGLDSDAFRKKNVKRLNKCVSNLTNCFKCLSTRREYFFL